MARILDLHLVVRDKVCPWCGGNQLDRPVSGEYTRKGQLFCRVCRKWITEAEIDSHAPSPEQFYAWLKSKKENGAPFLNQIVTDLGRIVRVQYLRQFYNAMERIHPDVRKEITWGDRKNASIKIAARKLVPRPWAPPIEKGIFLWYAVNLLPVLNHEQQLELCKRVQDGSLNLSQIIVSRMEPYLAQGRSVQDSYLLTTARSEEVSLLYGMQLAMIGDDEFVRNCLLDMGFDHVTAANATRVLVEMRVLEESLAGIYNMKTEFQERISKSFGQMMKEGKIPIENFKLAARDPEKLGLIMRVSGFLGEEEKKAIYGSLPEYLRKIPEIRKHFFGTEWLYGISS